MLLNISQLDNCLKVFQIFVRFIHEWYVFKHYITLIVCAGTKRDTVEIFMLLLYPENVLNQVQIIH